jgi:hypothetical protein
MNYNRNQLVDIIEEEGNIKVISLQCKSTPGIYYNLELEGNTKCEIRIRGYKLKSSKVRLWIAYSNNKVIQFDDNYLLTNEDTELKYTLINEGSLRENYKVGLLFSNVKEGNTFILTDYSINITTTEREYISNNEYLFIYYYKSGNGHPSSKWQLDIRDNVEGYMDCISLLEVTTEILNRYKVIIIDYLALARYNPLPNRDKYLEQIRRSKCRKAIYLTDLHEYTFIYDRTVKPNSKCNKPNNKAGIGVKELIKFIDRYGFHYLISKCQCKEFDNILEEGKDIIKGHYYLPHHIDGNIFKNYNMDKTYDIVMYGIYHKNTYPFRNRLKNLLLKHKDRLRIKVIQSRRPIYNEGLSKLLNKSWIGIATKSNFNYLVRKYFEISASNCIVLGDMPDQGKGIWKDNYINVNNNMTDKEILDIVFDSLDNKDMLIDKSNKIMKIMTDYRYDKIGIKLNRLCRSIIG